MKDENGGEGAPPDLKTRTKAFALRIIRLYGALPKTTEAQVIGKQILRCGTSVGSIIVRRRALDPVRSLSAKLKPD